MSSRPLGVARISRSNSASPRKLPDDSCSTPVHSPSHFAVSESWAGAASAATGVAAVATLVSSPRQRRHDLKALLFEFKSRVSRWTCNKCSCTVNKKLQLSLCLLGHLEQCGRAHAAANTHRR